MCVDTRRALAAHTASIGLVLLLVVVPTPGASADTWTQVLSEGFDDPNQKQCNALAFFGEYIYAASQTDGDGGTTARLLRAPLSDDTAWEDASPDWGASGEVVDLLPLDSWLWVGLSSGELWFRDGLGSWTHVDVPWDDGAKILALSRYPPPGSGPNLLAVALSNDAEGEVWTRDRGLWTMLAPTGESNVGSGRLHPFGACLYFGVGDASARDRTCEAIRTCLPAAPWAEVSDDCFGDPDLVFVSAMQAFGGHLYFGTAGHSRRGAILARLNGTIEDVTPVTCDPLGFERCVLRYGSMAVAGDRLYVGTRTQSDTFMGGDVYATSDGTRFDPANEPGFGGTNDTVSALAGRGTQLYAGTVNLLSGFEVWRRVPTLVELSPDLLRELADYLHPYRDYLACLATPCALLQISPVEEAFERIRNTFGSAPGHGGPLPPIPSPQGPPGDKLGLSSLSSQLPRPLTSSRDASLQRATRKLNRAERHLAAARYWLERAQNAQSADYESLFLGRSQRELEKTLKPTQAAVNVAVLSAPADPGVEPKTPHDCSGKKGASPDCGPK